VKSISSIAIVGSGALGLYYGARLARAGADVSFLARSDLDVLRTRGIAVKATDGDFALPSVKAAGTPEEIGPVDLVIITLKATANDQLARILPPLIHANTVVINLQNGLGVDEPVAAVVGAERTLGGLCFICANRIAPGVAECTMPGHVVIGEFAGELQPRTRAVTDWFVRADVQAEIGESLVEARWRKLVWNVPFNGLSVVYGGMTTDVILESPEREAEVWALMREVQAAAAAYGFKIPEDFVTLQVERTRPMGPYKPSTMLDYLAGRPLELEPIWGEPLRRARAKGVETPRLAALYERLLPLAAGRMRGL
jgi:2-dehydropantoate 2-reductase